MIDDSFDVEALGEEIAITTFSIFTSAVSEYIDIIKSLLAEESTYSSLDTDTMILQLEELLVFAIDWELWDEYDRIVEVLEFIFQKKGK